MALLLIIGLLAKFADQNYLSEIEEWAKAHQDPLGRLLKLTRPPPHAATFRRVFGDKLDKAGLELILSRHFTHSLSNSQTLPGGGRGRGRGSVIMSIDGKALRSTIPFLPDKPKGKGSI